MQQTRIDSPGPHIARKELDRFIRKMRKLRPSPVFLVAGGSVPPGVPTTIYYDLIKEAKSYQVRTILDSEGQWLKEGIKAKPYLIKPNIQEAEALMERELDTEDAIIEAALDLRKMGIEVVVISRGKDGIIAAAKGIIIKVVPPQVKVRSAVGAGDCTIAGLALKLTYGESLTEACRLAVAMGTAAVLTPGTELCRKPDVEELLPQVQIWEETSRRRSKSYFGVSTAGRV
jgi:6-phosphofructokinase 2